MQEQHFAVIGYPLSHSFSPAFFSSFFAQQGLSHCRYFSIPIKEAKDIKSTLSQYLLLRGFNVTLPHKLSMLELVDERTDEANRAGAINCVAIKDGKWWGHNTDIEGFRESLLKYLRPHHTKALILGDGGAAAAVRVVLEQLNISFQSVVRTIKHSAQIQFDELTKEHIAQHTLIVNTTPVGMHPLIQDTPLLLTTGIGKQHLLYDLIYHPSQTLFLQKGKENGAQIINGLHMLELQAMASWRYWQSFL